MAETELRIRTDGSLEWPNFAEEYVVLESGSLDSVWTVWPRIIHQVGSTHRAETEIRAGDTARFYRLVTGHQFFDQFDGSREQWTEAFPDPADSGKWGLSYDGALRIQYDPGTTPGSGRTVFLPPEPHKSYKDMTLSLDILDWDENASRQTIGVIARLTDWGYVGRVNFNDPAFGGRASMAISLSSPLTRVPWDADPQKEYRLIFSLSGSQLTLRLFDLDDLTNAVAALSVRDETRSGPGKVGVWVNANWGASSMDTVVDDFVVTEVLP